jgi:hypothetical protein
VEFFLEREAAEPVLRRICGRGDRFLAPAEGEVGIPQQTPDDQILRAMHSEERGVKVSVP